MMVQEDADFALFEAADRMPSSGAPKRALDIAVVLAALMLLAPVLALLALIIKLDSRGPLLFRQCRIGKDGKPFQIFKFRSMHVMEDGAEVVQAVKDDVRITRAGRFMRALSLDELPQIFNVLNGDMSLVGPRPHAAAHDEYYSARVTNYALRHQAKPGITGWAQVNGLRGPTPEIAVMQARIDHDVWYVRNGSFLLDLKILTRTPLEVLKRRNAH